jgi:hypothetical protein
MSKRTLGRFVAQSELQMRRRQLIQPVPCWEYKWVAISTVRLRQWVKTDKKQVINAALCLSGIVAMDLNPLLRESGLPKSTCDHPPTPYSLPSYALLFETRTYITCCRNSQTMKIRQQLRSHLCQTSLNRSRVTKRRKMRKGKRKRKTLSHHARVK